VLGSFPPSLGARAFQVYSEALEPTRLSNQAENNSTTGWKDYIVGGGSALAQTSNLDNSDVNYYWTDHVASTRQMEDAAGNVLCNAIFTPFGSTVSDCGNTHYKFTGLERDVTETGLDHALFRQYNSFSGRWMTPDPAGLAAADPANPQTWNRYAYVMNTPANMVDPLGLQGVCQSHINLKTPQATCDDYVVIPGQNEGVMGMQNWDIFSVILIPVVTGPGFTNSVSGPTLSGTYNGQPFTATTTISYTQGAVWGSQQIGTGVDLVGGFAFFNGMNGGFQAMTSAPSKPSTLTQLKNTAKSFVCKSSPEQRIIEYEVRSFSGSGPRWRTWICGRRNIRACRRGSSGRCGRGNGRVDIWSSVWCIHWL